jgi:ABC-2 type transport system permease protein
VIGTIAAVTLRRLVRGRAVWIGLAIAALPIVFAIAARGRTGTRGGVLDLLILLELLFAVLPPLFVASSIGDDIEDRTTTYLWSRPLPRWTILAGKLLALVPIVVALQVASGAAALAIAGALSASACIAMAAGAAAASLVAAGIATLVPKHGMALTICYVLLFDLPVGFLPASLRQASITHQVRTVAGLDPTITDAAATAAIGMAAVAGVWLALALYRIRRLEA